MSTFNRLLELVVEANKYAQECREPHRLHVVHQRPFAVDVKLVTSHAEEGEVYTLELDDVTVGNGFVETISYKVGSTYGSTLANGHCLFVVLLGHLQRSERVYGAEGAEGEGE